MGYNTNVTFLNDALGTLERNADEFFVQLKKHLFHSGSFGVGCHGNPVYVQSTEHADVTQLIIVGGNFSTRVVSSRVPGLRSHHTTEGQIELLRVWADKLGFRVIPNNPPCLDCPGANSLMCCMTGG